MYINETLTFRAGNSTLGYQNKRRVNIPITHVLLRVMAMASSSNSSLLCALNTVGLGGGAGSLEHFIFLPLSSMSYKGSALPDFFLIAIDFLAHSYIFPTLWSY